MKNLKIIHSLGQNRCFISKTVSTEQDISFLLTNNIGGFLWLSERPLSHYQGWFFSPFHLRGKKMFKIIENIGIRQGPAISEIRNNFWNIERVRDKIIEKFFLFQEFDALVYEVENCNFLNSSSQNKDLIVELFLDIRDAYQNVKMGREYKIYFEDDILVIEYYQSGLDIAPIFLVVKNSSAKIKEIKNWVSRDYTYDSKRQGFREERWVFQACEIVFQKLGKIVFSVSTNKNKAIQESKYIFNNLSSLKQKENNRVVQLLEKFYFKLNQLDSEKRMACVCAFDALRKMAVFNQINKKIDLAKRNNLLFNQGIFAGLPWFFQFWVRDEAICLKSFYDIDPQKAKSFLFKELSLIDKQGHINGSSDGVGWIFKRIGDFLEKNIFNKQEKKIISQKIEKSIDGLLKHYTQNGFALSLKQQTWMDSLDRSGVYLEIQSLRLNIYQLAYCLTNKNKYLILEEKMACKVKEKFFKALINSRQNKRFLIDGWDRQGIIDLSLRSNVFLAFYIYPDLLHNKEWKECFKNSLSGLWLKWGGISSLDRKSSLFHREHTGEMANSYHQGDSWFWVNNLTGIVLHQVDKKSFQRYINKISETSANDILWQGIIGHHSELSSAEYFKAQGCLSQAWSSAMFIEFCLLLNKSFF